MIFKEFRRIGPLGLIILLHVAFLYALQSGLLHRASQALQTNEVVVSFITPEKPPEPERPAPQPKTETIVRKAVAPPPSVVPVVNTTPSETAITVPVQAPTPVVPVEPVAAAAPVVAAPAPIKTVSSGVEYIRAPQPEYPPISKRLGEEGKVVLRVLINESGRPDQAEIKTSSGSRRLDEAARQAALRALYKPYIEDGKAVPVYVLVPINFQN